MLEATVQEEGEMPVIPPKDKGDRKIHAGIVFSESLLKRLDEISEAEGYSRNKTIVFMLEWAIGAYEAEKAAKKGAR